MLLRCSAMWWGCWCGGGSPAVWTVMSQIFVVSVQTEPPLHSREARNSKAVLPSNDVTLWIPVTDNRYLLFLTPLSHLLFSTFVSALHSIPLIQQPLGVGRFITMHNEWIVCSLQNKKKRSDWSVSISALVAGHQHNTTQHNSTHLMLPGFNYLSTLPCSATWVVWRSNQITADVLFRPLQHRAAVPRRSLINSCHWSHNQYLLISHVCVTLPSQTINTQFQRPKKKIK